MVKQTMEDRYSSALKWILLGGIGLLGIALALKSTGM